MSPGRRTPGRRRRLGEGVVVHRRTPPAELVALGEDLRRGYIADKIWAGTRALTQRHLDAGQQVWLVTATPVELAQTIADRLGLTGALGTVAESEDGIFTGRLVGDVLHGLGKAHAVRSLAIREGLNLQRCTAYSRLAQRRPDALARRHRRRYQPRFGPQRHREGARVESYDFRVARKAAKYGVPTAIALGALGGGAAAAVRRGRRASRSDDDQLHQAGRPAEVASRSRQPK